MTFIGIALLVIAGIMAVQGYNSLIEGETVKGSTHEYVNLNDEEGTKRYPNIKFTTKEGKVFYFIDTNRTGIGSRQQKSFDVIYDPSDPTRAMVYNKMDVFGISLITGTTGIGALAFGLLAARIQKKREGEQDV